MRLVLVLLVLVSIGCAMKMTGTRTREISIGQQAVPMTDRLALVERLRATIEEWERTTDTTKRRELALRARQIIKVLKGQLQEPPMPKPEDGPPGQQKVHNVIYPDGSTGTMTQEEWVARDKSLGIKRVGPDGKPIEE